MTTKFILIPLVLVLVLFILYSCNSYKPINKEKSDSYYFNFSKTEVHYIPMGNSFELGNDVLKEADVKTAKVLSRNYLKDTTHIYFKSTLIKNADVNSFEILCAKNGSFAKDKNTVYFESHSFKDIDVASFQFVGNDCGPTLKDKDHVYSTYTVAPYSEGNLLIEPIPSVHASDYQFLNDVYGKDQHVAYCKGKVMPDSDAGTFSLLNDYYAKDKQAVYFDGTPIKGLDPSTFLLIEGGSYARDKNGIYFGLNTTEDTNGKLLHYTAKSVAGADPETFTMIKGEKIDYAKDKTKYYWGGVAQ